MGIVLFTAVTDFGCLRCVSVNFAHYIFGLFVPFLNAMFLQLWIIQCWTANWRSCHRFLELDFCGQLSLLLSTMLPVMAANVPVPPAEKQPYSMMVSPLCSLIGMIVLGCLVAFDLQQRLYFSFRSNCTTVVWSDHKICNQKWPFYNSSLINILFINVYKLKRIQ